MAARRRSLSNVLGSLSDDDFWTTRGAQPERARVAEAVERDRRNTRRPIMPSGSKQPAGAASAGPQANEPGEATAPERRDAAPSESPAALQTTPSAARPGSRPAASLGMPEQLRPRNARRGAPTGRIVVRVPADAMRWFGAVARLRGMGKAVLFERVVAGFLDLVERDGPAFLVTLQSELGLGRHYEVEDDVWGEGTSALVVDERPAQVAVAQMSHAVERSLERRFDECCWRWELAKDALGRLVVLAYLARFARQHPDLQPALGFGAPEVEELARSHLR